jgi:hypothetical protein
MTALLILSNEALKSSSQHKEIVSIGIGFPWQTEVRIGFSVYNSRVFLNLFKTGSFGGNDCKKFHKKPRYSKSRSDTNRKHSPWWITMTTVRKDTPDAIGCDAKAVLDSLSAHIAILDCQGVILETNRTWRDFAQNNQVQRKNSKFVYFLTWHGFDILHRLVDWTWTVNTLRTSYACDVMKPFPVQAAIIVALLVIFIGLIGFSEFLHTHDDPFYHDNCPICQWHLVLSALFLFACCPISACFHVTRFLASPVSPRRFQRHIFSSNFLRAPPSFPCI